MLRDGALLPPPQEPLGQSWPHCISDVLREALISVPASSQAQAQYPSGNRPASAVSLTDRETAHRNFHCSTELDMSGSIVTNGSLPLHVKLTQLSPNTQYSVYCQALNENATGWGPVATSTGATWPELAALQLAAGQRSIAVSSALALGSGTVPIR